MPIPLPNFPLLSPEQANPFMYGMKGGFDIGKQAVQLPGQLEQQKLINALKGIELQYAPQMTQAELAYKQAQTPNLQAQTGLLGQQTKWYGPKAQSEIGEAGARSRLLGEQAKYYGPKTESEMRQADALSRLYGEQTKYYGPKTEADIAGTEATTRLNNEQANWFGKSAEAQIQQQVATGRLSQAQADQIYLKLPGEMQKQKVDLYGADPLLQRAALLQNAQAGGINPQLLGAMGLGGAQQQAQPQLAPIPQSPRGGPQMDQLMTKGGQAIAPEQLAQQLQAPGAQQSPQALQNYLNTGSTAGLLPKQQQAAIEHGLIRQQELEANNFDKMQTTAHGEAEQANKLDDSIDQFRNAYDKLSIKGYFRGKIPDTSAEANEARNAAQNMQAALFSMFKGRLTNQEMQFVQGLKLSPEMNPAAVQQIGDFMKAKGERAREGQSMMAYGKAMGLDSNTISTLKNQYEHQRPVYDFNNREKNGSYLNTWKDYFTPQALEAARNGEIYTPPNQKVLMLKNKLTEKNIKHTMEETGIKSKDEVLKLVSDKYGVPLDQVKSIIRKG